ncbi:iron complex outermembrane receptor protein [Hephaestia caeni]|uniref:Iron complex outermembrane receptor protein n=1 Tax=Hephaestia caeni TaxID=645617 RepID=A0A397P9X9_9SPHN|nr:TonB-dependent receptor [Hephaestia caeni]RIA43985.1 iron complex outermembrane receptor protein [Hephaestia caeni]
MLRFTRHRASFLYCGVAPIGLVLASLASPASAQDTQTATPPAADTSAQDTEEAPVQDIVVTGSILKTDTATPSPVTTITVENLDQRGISTTQDAIQSLSANNGPALTNSFSANGAFAGGASAVSLRGLSTNSTLVLFDGMRAAYYPLADDGTRNFVDLNTIPDDIIDQVQVVRDGASSTYGADAIAGVVNIITKRQFKGLTGRVEGGISERGDASQYRLSLTGGVGDIDEQGYNAYLSGFYYRSEQLFNRQRPYPYNSDDLRNVCNDGTCGPNNVIDGLDGDGNYPGFSANTTNLGSTLYVAPFDSAAGVAAGRYQMLNPGVGCPRGTAYDLSAGDLADNPLAPTTVCQEDLTQNYGVITPEIERFGFSGRVTAKVGDSSEAYGELNFLQTEVSYDGLPSTIRGNAPAPFYFPRYSTSSNIAYYGNNTILQLPVYVCPRETQGACTAANGTINPNNPYADQGQTAAVIGRLPNLTEHNESRTRAYRFAAGIKGDLSDRWSYNFNATAMHMDLRRKNTGYVYIQHLLDVVADGSYNFLDPSANSQDVLDYLAPTAQATSTSDLVQAEGTVTGDLFELPGGPLQFGAGVSVRYEAVDSPSINSDINGGTERYYRLNGFATKGHRTVYSAFAELNAPILDPVSVNLSGRYDRYSGGLDNFSPKVGVKFTPIQQVVLRGTYSRGFRVPSFGEADATFPTTGYVTASRGIYPDSYLAQYGCTSEPNDYNTNCPTYIRNASYGLTTLGNPDLKPEKSRSWTVGALIEPIPGVSFTADYYNIKKTGAISAPNFAPAIAAYYTGQPIPDGYTVIPDAADTGTPGALPRIAFVQAAFINANTIKSEGLDFSASVDLPITNGFRISSQAEASYILKLSTTFPDGTVERYDGTLGNFNLTAGSGTPKWRGYWLTTLDFDDFRLSGTVNYMGGYDLSAMDQGGAYKDCGLSDGSVPCRVDDYVTFDLTAQIPVTDKFTFYTTVLNVFDDLPPLDPVTYGAHLYNPVQGGTGILGRYIKAGAKFSF